MRRPLPVILVTLALLAVSGALITWLWFELNLGGGNAPPVERPAPSAAIAPGQPRTPLQPAPPDTRLDDIKSDKPGLRVLFVGNSHTFMNDVPGLVTKLSEAAKVERPLLAYSESPGGMSFRMHWENGRIQKLVKESKWDLVVLQDQSVMPNLTRGERDTETLPFAKHLNDAVRESGARTVLFMTWGYQAESPAMLERSRVVHEELAATLKSELVPVGTAWERALAKRPGFMLWSGDGNHADIRGSYLAACAFLAAFYGKSPVGNSFTADINAEEAAFLQGIANEVVKAPPGGLAAMPRTAK